MDSQANNLIIRALENDNVHFTKHLFADLGYHVYNRVPVMENNFRYHFTYLKLIAKYGSLNILKYILEETDERIDFENLMEHLAYYNCLNMLQYIDKKYGISNSDKIPIIDRAVDKLNIEIVKYFLPKTDNYKRSYYNKYNSRLSIPELKEKCPHLLYYIIENTDTDHLINDALDISYTNNYRYDYELLELLINKNNESRKKKVFINKLFEEIVNNKWYEDDLIKFLIETCGVNPNRANERALQSLCAKGNSRLVGYLIYEHSADVFARQNRALKLAKKYKCTETIKILEDYMNEVLSEIIEHFSFPDEIKSLIKSFLI